MVDPAVKDKAAEIIKKVVERFGPAYSKHYVLAIAQAKMAEQLAKPEKFMLEQRPPPDDKSPPLMTGYLMKEGAVRKNWKKRYFVVKPNFEIDYYEKDNMKKKKGTIQPVGFRVHTDLGNTFVERAKALAEKVGIDVDKLPKPKTYPEGTVELYHPRRRCWYVKLDDEKTRDDWIKAFRTCCLNCPDLTIDDEYHEVAFPKAMRELRWSLGRCGWYSKGNEQQVLSETISEELEWEVMGDVYAKLRTMPGPAMSMARKKAQQMMDGMVGTAVKPAWAAASQAPAQVRPKVEPVVAQQVEPIGKEKAKLREKLKEKCQEQLDKGATEFVAPHVEKLCKLLSPEADAAMAATKKAVEEQLDAAITAKCDDAALTELDRKGRSRFRNYEARQALRGLYDPLWLLRTVFKTIAPWSVVYDGNERFDQLFDDALYTFAKAVRADGADKADKIKADVMERFAVDAAKARTRFISHNMLELLRPLLDVVLDPLLDAAVKPLADAIPDPVNQFLDPVEEVRNLVDEIIKYLIEKAVGIEPDVSKEPAALERQRTRTLTQSQAARADSDDEAA
eukprot:CAMPEP_0198338038 /NCGR_PEP_ID=MMETSP1450-20131203/32457_1 /TAXON_ID=753684 ORGANISM="Madagascaria erythrocladiodes, Strain CCMP3234" /NCGR_SAMPLE_ID=MMETSP1450 /ASSEMBLY_ACC=CAM_ASM_001115 /LENGTH=563 /DNA_ID=CAMNT_0044042893 /DNA_START=71 /DNA_END=1759 /DNA_ORIENTATION=+